jgi:hypothetical protein
MVEFSVKISFNYRRKGIRNFFSRNFLILEYRANADYYASIKDPIDLIQIQQKIHSDEYTSYEQFLDDIELLINNAKSFYRVKLNFVFFNKIAIFHFRKIPWNGKMQMNYRNIFIRKLNLNQSIRIISKNFLQLFIMLNLMIVL